MLCFPTSKMETKIPPQQGYDKGISDHNPVFEKGGNLQCRGQGSVDFEFLSFGTINPIIATGGRSARISLGFTQAQIVNTFPQLLMYQMGKVSSVTLQLARGYAITSASITTSRRPDLLCIAPYSRPLQGTLPNPLHLPGCQGKMIPHTYHANASSNSSSNHNMMWVIECTNHDPQYSLATYHGGVTATGGTAMSNAPLPLDDDTTRNPTFWHMFIIQRTLFSDSEDDEPRYFPYMLRVRFECSGIKFSPLTATIRLQSSPSRFNQEGGVTPAPQVSSQHLCLGNLGDDGGEPATKKTRATPTMGEQFLMIH